MAQTQPCPSLPPHLSYMDLPPTPLSLPLSPKVTVSVS